MSDLALIVVDEEHDLSYKQEETPRYHGRDVAVMRAKVSDAAIVLGSATPSLESFQNAGRKYRLIEMPDRVLDRALPEVEIIDMREEFRETGQEPVVSRKLAEEIKDRLERKEQVLVLLNRRGYAPVVLCRTCGETVQCRNCDIPLTHHKGARRMECHYCGFIARVPKSVRSAAVNTCISWAPDQRSSRNCCTECSPPPESHVLIEIRFAVVTTSSASCRL